MTKGSKIQAMMGQPVERVWAVYVDRVLVRGYIRKRADALAFAKAERARIGETPTVRGLLASRVRIFPM